MMKKVNALIMVLAMIVPVLSFTACGGDNEDTNENNSPNTVNTDGKFLVKVSYFSDECLFNYDEEGRINGLDPYSTPYTEIIYQDNYITMDHYLSFERTFKLSNGLIIGYGKTNYTYEKGYLKEIISEDEKEVFRYKFYYYKFYWNDGNLTQVEYLDQSGLTIITIDYSSLICTNYLLNYCLLRGYLMGDWHGFFIDAFGKRSKNLISRIHEICYNRDGSKDYERDYIYEWTVDGRLPIRAKKQHKETFSYNNENHDVYVDDYYIKFYWE